MSGRTALARRGCDLEDLARRVSRSPRRPAVVVDTAWVNGLAAVRALGRAGIPVVAVDWADGGLGGRSRYAHPLPSPRPDDEAGFLGLLSALGDALGGGVPIFPTHDPALNALARNAAELGDRFLYPFPGWGLLERIQEKRFQLEQAEAVGVPIPRTEHPESVEEALRAADTIGYPVLVKPSRPAEFRRRFRRQAIRCESRAELEKVVAEALDCAPMIQEVVPGGDDELYTLGSYVTADGEPLGLFCGRKLRQFPPGIGTCRVGEAVWVDEVVEQGLRLLGRLRFTGISQVEFKRDPRDGRFKLMEINPRLWQWHGLAAECGVNLPLLAYRDLTGDRPDPVRMRGSGKRWAISLLAGDEVAFQCPPYVDAVLALDDPLPGLVQVARVLRKSLVRGGRE